MSTGLEQTFLHFPGIGARTEQRLWDAGVENWEALRARLSSGSSPFVAPSRRRGANEETTFKGTHATAWLRACDESIRALQRRNLRYFVDLLPPAEHLRVVRNRLEQALYLDIETTGLSPYHSGVTVIGALFENTFHQWVWPQKIDGLARLLKAAPLVVTYNGRRFDVPFLQQHMPALPEPRAHVDLRYIAARLGISGGQKAVEEHLKLRRPREVDGLDGADAVALWCDAVYGNPRSLDQLLHYNRADCEQLKRITEVLLGKRSLRAAHSATGHVPATYQALRRAWRRERPTLAALLDKLPGRRKTSPRVVGIDLRGNPRNPTGWALCDGSTVSATELRSDEEIIRRTLHEQPDLISIDAPLALPRGRRSPYDDSPCRKEGGIVRDAERILWSRGIGVYPALIPHMQGLTARGIRLAETFRSAGIEVIESYPGAAQDILGIPRKQRGLELLRGGLEEFGFRLTGELSHDELDAVTSALVGFFYLADQHEGLGAEDECFLIVPRWTATKSWT